MNESESSIIIEKVAYGMTIGDLKFGNVRPGVVEATLKPGKTLEEALDELDDRLTEWHKKRYPHLYQEWPTVQGSDGQTHTLHVAPVINKETERLEILIDNAPDLSALAKYKEDAGKNGMVSQYMRRVNELTLNANEIK